MISKFRVLKWFGSGVAFAAALLCAGCSALPCFHGNKTSDAAEPRQYTDASDPALDPAPPPIDAHAVGSEIYSDSPLIPAPIINIFGEADGAPRRTTPLAAEFGFQQHTASDDGYDADVAIDPTGQWLAFTSTRHSERSDIYLQRVDGSSVIQLTSDPAPDAQPVFSPDGKKIAFCSTRSGNWDIYLMDIDGRNVEQLTNTPAQEIHPSFSPDGTRLVYCALSPRSEQWELWVVELATQSRKTIGPGLFPVWSPRKDIDRIAFQRARQRGSRWFSVWTLDLVNGEPSRPTEVAVSSNAAVVCPNWSPDGRRLVFTTINEPNRAIGTRAAGRQDVWVIHDDGTGRQRLTNSEGVNLAPVWAVDNRVYFISDRGGHENIWSVRVGSGKSWFAEQSPRENRPSVPPAVGSADPAEH